MMTYVCPWCGCETQPLKTAENRELAVFQFSSGNDAAVRRNPFMCSECHGVGGREDFEVTE